VELVLALVLFVLVAALVLGTTERFRNIVEDWRDRRSRH
jgi:hypothetical protein